MNVNKNPTYDHSTVNEYNLGILHSSMYSEDDRGGETEDDAWFARERNKNSDRSML